MGAESESGDGMRFPLERAHRRMAGLPEPDAGAWRRAGSDLGLPVARLRELAAFYPDILRKDPTVQVCAGTSCFLNGGDAVRAALPEVRFVHCLGHCDRSPCVAGLSGTVLSSCQAEGIEAALTGGAVEEPERPAIRCTAPEPIVTRNLAERDGYALKTARERGAYEALERALSTSPTDVLEQVQSSEVRGRGGAGFPTGSKWTAARNARGEAVVVANGDEGDPGSFVDRVLLEDDPHAVLEGLALCAYAVGAREGVVFVRSEYPRALERVRAAIADAREHGYLGAGILGSDFSLEVHATSGFGSYVAGEETALLQTLEGRAGEVRLRPPYPVESGLEGRPTVVNNVETLAAIPWIVRRGAAAYRRFGTAASSGTIALCLNAGFDAPGIVEVELGRSLRRVIEEDGRSSATELEAVLLGGPMGSLLFPEEWDVPLCYRELAERKVQLGHGGIVAIPRGVDWIGLLRHWLDFMARESCGKCVPCREGSRRNRDAVERGDARADRLDAALALMEDTSLCGFGKGAPGPVRKLLARFGNELLAVQS